MKKDQNQALMSTQASLAALGSNAHAAAAQVAAAQMAASMAAAAQIAAAAAAGSAAARATAANDDDVDPGKCPSVKAFPPLLGQSQSHFPESSVLLTFKG